MGDPHVVLFPAPWSGLKKAAHLTRGRRKGQDGRQYSVLTGGTLLFQVTNRSSPHAAVQQCNCSIFSDLDGFGQKLSARTRSLVTL